MSKDIDIQTTFVKVPTRITVGGKKYPITQHNIKVVNEYWLTGEKTVLDKLNEYSIVF
jgi:hypothetical protein